MTMQKENRGGRIPRAASIELEQTMQRDFTSAASHQRPAPAPGLGDLTSVHPAQRPTTSRAEFTQVLRRAGYSTTQAQSILRDLPDPIDFDRDCETLFRRGISLNRLIDAMGGSP
jgi:hypothetical protein